MMNSVAMCTYNGEKYIKEQLESIIHQTLPPDEIIICDDGSNDHTISAIKETMRVWRGSWMLVQNEKNLGYKKNFQKAISLCQGDIIYLSDQDDVWDLHKMELMNQIFVECPEVVTVFHDAELVDESLHVLYPSFWRASLDFNYREFLTGDYRKVLDHNVMQGSASAFRRIVFEKARPFPEEAVHDEWLLLVSLLIGKVVPLPKQLLKYRQANNVIGGMPVTFLEKVKKWGGSLRSALVQHQSEIIRRACVLDELMGRAESCEAVSNFSNLLKHYYSFLKIRYSCITRHNLKVLGALGNYIMYYRWSHGTKCALKDLLVIVLSD